MLRLLNIFHSTPHTFKVSPTATFQPGMMAQLTVIDNEIFAEVSNGTTPVGIIDDIKNETDDSTVSSNRMTVWVTRGIFQTDQYEQTDYPVNANLYCSEQGLFTTRRSSQKHPAVATVLGFNDGLLELLWL